MFFFKSDTFIAIIYVHYFRIYEFLFINTQVKLSKNDYRLYHFCRRKFKSIEKNVNHVTFEDKIQYRITILIGSSDFYPDGRKSSTWFLKEV